LNISLKGFKNTGLTELTQADQKGVILKGKRRLATKCDKYRNNLDRNVVSHIMMS